MKRVFRFSAKVLRALLFTILIVVIGITIFLNTNFMDEILKNQLEKRLGGALKREVKVDTIAFNPFRLDFLLKNFTIGNDPRSPEIPFFQADQIYARISWQKLVGGKVRISAVRVISPELNIIFYKGGGNNWPKTEKKEKKKDGGIDLIVSKVDIENMIVVLNQQRIPLTFSCNDLEAFVEYDNRQQNYLATTTFENGFLKIKDFEYFKFDLKSSYRIIGGRVHFDRLFFLSDRSKFYMAGEMYNLSKPFFDFRFRSHIDLTQTKEMFHFGPEMSGTGTFRAVYKGTFENFRMQGSGAFKNFIFYSLPIDHARFNLDMTENWLEVTEILAEMFRGSYAGNFSISPLKGSSVFKTDGVWKNWDGRELGKLIRMKDMIFPVKSSGSASIRWPESGIRNLTGTMQIRVEPYGKVPLDLAQMAEDTDYDESLFAYDYVLPFFNTTELRFAGRQLRDIRSHLELPYTTADIEGNIDFSGVADLNVTSVSQKISEIDLLFHHLQSYFQRKPVEAQEFWGVEGSADFQGKLDATVWGPFRPRITGEVIGTNVLYHGVLVDRIRGDVQFHHKLIEVLRADMALDGATGEARARFFLADKERGQPDAMALEASVKNFPVHEIAHAFNRELPIDGTTDATLVLKGPFSALEGKAEFQSTGGELWDQPWGTATGRVLFFPDSLGIRDLTVRLNGGLAQMSGDLVYDNYDYNVNFSAQNLPLEKIQAFKAKGIDISGIVAVNGSGSGTLRRPLLTGEVQVGNLRYKNEFYGDVTAQVALNKESLGVEASGMARGVKSDVRANMILDGNLPFEAYFDIRKFPLEIITRVHFPNAPQIAGLIGGNFEVAGTMRPANVETMTGTLDLVEISYRDILLKQSQPVEIVLAKDVIDIRNGHFTGDHLSVDLTGQIHPEEEIRLDLHLDATVELEILQSWDRNITSDGTGAIKVAIGGTLKQPSLTGVMEVKDGFFRHYSFPNSLTDITSLITFKNRSITLQSFQASSSGGKLTAGGSAALKGYSLDDYRFDIYAQRIRVHFPEGLRSTVNAELHLQSDQKASYLVGDINVVQGVYVRSFEESPDIFNYSRVPTFAGVAGAPAAAGRQINLNIRIQSDGGILVRNNFANIQSSADLTLIGTIDNPVLIGRMEVVDGTVTFRDRQYNVVRGSLDFANPYQTEAVLNFAAETRIREYHITLNFQGTFEQIYHDLSSDPPLPKDDIYALLGIGRTPEEVEGGLVDVPTLLAGQEISSFIANPLTSPLERGFKRVFGLERFQIDPTYVQSTEVATARITVQKDISTDFSITYSANVFTAAEEIILLQYQLTDDIQVTASKDERSRYGIDVLVTKTFE